MSNDPTDLELLIEKLRWLRLPGMARTVTDLLASADRDNWTPAQIVHRLVEVLYTVPGRHYHPLQNFRNPYATPGRRSRKIGRSRT